LIYSGIYIAALVLANLLVAWLGPWFSPINAFVLIGQSDRERQSIHRACLPIVEHNFRHFYMGGLTNILWPELTGMLHGLRK
jgi:hypothetical protein